MTETYYIEIRTYEDEVIKRMGPLSKRKAEKVDDGVNTNLDHANFYTAIVGEDAE
jgi:hypothetical protein